MARFVFLGPPGAGKGTQAIRVAEQLGIPAIVTGAIFRAAISKESAMGREVAQFVNSGLLVPDPLTNAVVTERLKEKDCKRGFLLDGYPRSLVQAQTLDAFLSKAKTPLELVLYFNVSAEMVIERMGMRRVCSQCGTPYNLVSQLPKIEGKCDKCGAALIKRVDDQPQSIRQRLSLYQSTTKPLLDYYEKQGILKIVDASLSVADVSKVVSEICGAK